MKRTRAQQPKVVEEPNQDPATATATNPKPQRRAKQPRQPKAAGGARTKSGAAGPRAAAASVAAAAAAAAAANASSAAASSPAGGPEVAPTVPDVMCVGIGGGDGGEDAGDARRAVDWELDDDAGLSGAAAAWWTWGVDEEKLLGWFPFVEEDFRCAGARAADAEVAAFDHDIWSIW